MLFSLSIFADYFQFYLEDEEVTTEVDNVWNDNIVTEQLAVATGLIVIVTARNMTVPVEIEVRDHAVASEDLASWDKVKECSLEIPSGRLVVLGNEYYPDATRIKVKPGCYRSRIYYGGLNTITVDGLEGEDHYKIVLWPAEFAEPINIK